MTKATRRSANAGSAQKVAQNSHRAKPIAERTSLLIGQFSLRLSRSVPAENRRLKVDGTHEYHVPSTL